MRLSRGRSTPTRRAMWWLFLSEGMGVPSVARRCLVVPRPWGRRSSRRRPGPRPPPGGDLVPASRTRSGHVVVFSCSALARRWVSRWRRSALALLVPGVLADHHDAAVATDHLALVTDLLDAGVDLHVPTS